MLKSSAMPTRQKYGPRKSECSGTHWAVLALAELLVRIPILPGGGILIWIPAAAYQRKPCEQPQPVEDEHQDHKKHESYGAICCIIRH